MRCFIITAIVLMTLAAYGQDTPEIYIGSTSTGNTWTALRDQSQEMAKDFAKDCPEIQVTSDRQSSDYTVVLTHIEIGLFNRMNQVKLEDMFGNLLSTKDVSSIRSGEKEVCQLIRADWCNQPSIRARVMNSITASFQKEAVAGYGEISGNELIVHSERASAMRFHMIVANPRAMAYLRRAGIQRYVYTNDADQRFEFDVKSGQIAQAKESSAPLPAPRPSPVPQGSQNQ